MANVCNVDSDPEDKNWLKRNKKKLQRKQPRRESDKKRNELRKPRFVPGN